MTRRFSTLSDMRNLIKKKGFVVNGHIPVSLEEWRYFSKLIGDKSIKPAAHVILWFQGYGLRVVPQKKINAIKRLINVT